MSEIDEHLKKAPKETEFEDEHSYERENTNSTYIYLIGALGLVLGYIVMQVNILRHDKKKKSTVQQTYQGRADIGGPWELIDLNGNKFSHLNLKGSYYLLYFGFCNCPDICPNSLHKLSKAFDRIKTMPEAKYINLKSVFVSVDPDRDSPERIQKFINLFHPEMIGLTAEKNDSPILKDMMRKFRIYATKIEYEMQNEESTAPKQNKKKDF